MSKKTKKTDEAKEVRLKDEDLRLLREKVTQIRNTKVEYANAHLVAKQYEVSLQVMNSELEAMMKENQEKYGAGTFDLQTGIVTPE